MCCIPGQVVRGPSIFMKKGDNMRIFVISDTHFNHKNVIKYTGRPYQSVEQMNVALINNWNNVVLPDDLVLFLGDFALGSKEEIGKFARLLNGHKVIILGNHDRSRNYYLENGFQDAMKHFVMPKEINHSNHDIIFSHQPRKGLDEDTVNIHGHIHEKELTAPEWNPEHYFNASVENINYTPIELNKIIQIKGW